MIRRALALAVLLLPILGRAAVTFPSQTVGAATCSSGTCSLAVPTAVSGGIVDNDVIIAVCGGRDTGSSSLWSISGTNWNTTAIKQGGVTSGSLAAFYCRDPAGAGTCGTATLTRSTQAGNSRCTSFLARGVDTTTAIDAVAASVTSDTTSPVNAPSITTSTAGSMIVQAFNGTSSSQPTLGCTSTTAIGQAAYGTSTSRGGNGACYVTGPSPAGATASMAATYSATLSTGLTFQFALKPAPVLVSSITFVRAATFVTGGNTTTISATTNSDAAPRTLNWSKQGGCDASDGITSSTDGAGGNATFTGGTGGTFPRICTLRATAADAGAYYQETTIKVYDPAGPFPRAGFPRWGATNGDKSDANVTTGAELFQTISSVTTTTGDTLIAFAAMDNGTAVTIDGTDNLGESWTLISSQQLSGIGVYLTMWKATVSSGGSGKTLKFNNTGTAWPIYGVMAYGGVGSVTNTQIYNSIADGDLRLTLTSPAASSIGFGVFVEFNSNGPLALTNTTAYANTSSGPDGAVIGEAITNSSAFGPSATFGYSICLAVEVTKASGTVLSGSTSGGLAASATVTAGSAPAGVTVSGSTSGGFSASATLTNTPPTPVHPTATTAGGLSASVTVTAGAAPTPVTVSGTTSGGLSASATLTPGAAPSPVTVNGSTSGGISASATLAVGGGPVTLTGTTSGGISASAAITSTPPTPVHPTGATSGGLSASATLTPGAAPSPVTVTGATAGGLAASASVSTTPPAPVTVSGTTSGGLGASATLTTSVGAVALTGSTSGGISASASLTQVNPSPAVITGATAGGLSASATLTPGSAPAPVTVAGTTAGGLGALAALTSVAPSPVTVAAATAGGLSASATLTTSLGAVHLRATAVIGSGSSTAGLSGMMPWSGTTNVCPPAGGTLERGGTNE